MSNDKTLAFAALEDTKVTIDRLKQVSGLLKCPKTRTMYRAMELGGHFIKQISPQDVRNLHLYRTANVLNWQSNDHIVYMDAEYIVAIGAIEGARIEAPDDGFNVCELGRLTAKILGEDLSPYVGPARRLLRMCKKMGWTYANTLIGCETTHTHSEKVGFGVEETACLIMKRTSDPSRLDAETEDLMRCLRVEGLNLKMTRTNRGFECQLKSEDYLIPYNFIMVKRPLITGEIVYQYDSGSTNAPVVHMTVVSFTNVHGCLVFVVQAHFNVEDNGITFTVKPCDLPADKST